MSALTTFHPDIYLTEEQMFLWQNASAIQLSQLPYYANSRPSSVSTTFQAHFTGITEHELKHSTRRRGDPHAVKRYERVMAHYRNPDTPGGACSDELTLLTKGDLLNLIERIWPKLRYKLIMNENEIRGLPLCSEWVTFPRLPRHINDFLTWLQVTAHPPFWLEPKYHRSHKEVNVAECRPIWVLTVSHCYLPEAELFTRSKPSSLKSGDNKVYVHQLCGSHDIITFLRSTSFLRKEIQSRSERGALGGTRQAGSTSAALRTHKFHLRSGYNYLEREVEMYLVSVEVDKLGAAELSAPSSTDLYREVGASRDRPARYVQVSIDALGVYFPLMPAGSSSNKPPNTWHREWSSWLFNRNSELSRGVPNGFEPLFWAEWITVRNISFWCLKDRLAGLDIIDISRARLSSSIL